MLQNLIVRERAQPAGCIRQFKLPNQFQNFFALIAVTDQRMFNRKSLVAQKANRLQNGRQSFFCRQPGNR